MKSDWWNKCLHTNR